MGALQRGLPFHFGPPDEESSAETGRAWEGSQSPPFQVAAAESSVLLLAGSGTEPCQQPTETGNYQLAL